MKKVITLLLPLLFAGAVIAQTDDESIYTTPDITKFISTLTKQQQVELRSVTTESKKTLEEYRQQLTDLHDEIQHYYGLPGDRSSDLFPLYAQRSALYVKIDQAKYYTKMRIDKILTDEQQKELRENLELERKKSEVKKQLTMFFHPMTQK